MLLLAQAQHHRAQQRARGQVEGAQGLIGGHPPGLGLALGRGQGAQVHHRERQGDGRVDELHRLAVARGEGGAQRFVATHHLGERLLETGHVGHALQAQREGHVVGRRARLELVDEPQSLLREGQRQRSRARRGDEVRHLQALARQARRVHRSRQRGEDRRLEQLAQRQRHAEGGADAGDHLRGQQRVATQREEVVLGAHARDAQHLRPERREQLLGGRARFDVRVLRGRRHQVRRGQRLAVHLAVGRQRQRVHHHQRRRHHVVRQPPGHEGAQRRGVQRPGRVAVRGRGHHVGHQSLVARPVLARQGHRLAHAGPGQQGGLDFGQLDAVAAHLHLRVRAAHEVEQAVLPPAHQVPGAVEARAGHAAEGVRHEALRGERGLLHVAPGEAVTADEQLAGDAHGHRLTVRVQHVDARVGQRPADGHRGARLRGLRHPEGGGEDGALRGAVAVGDGDAQLLQHAARMRRGHHVSTRQQLLQGTQRLQAGLHHLGEQAGRQPQRGDVRVAHHPAQFLHGGRVRREDDEAGAVQQRAPDLEGGGVEGDGGELEQRLVRPQRRVVHAEHGAQHPAVRNGDALGPARAAGGEVDVREAVRQGGQRGRGGGLRGERCVLQHHRRQPLQGQLLQQRARGDEHARARILHHGGEALARVRRVQRHVGATGLEDGDQRHHQLQRALDTRGHARVGGDAQAAQVVRELVGARVELAVGQLRPFELDGDLVGEAGHHGGEDLRQRGGARVRDGGGVPVHQHLPALAAGEQRDGGERGLGPGDQPRHQRAEVLRHAPDGGGLEQAGVVPQRSPVAVRRLGEDELQLELGGGELHLQRVHRQPLHAGRGRGRVLQGEEGLEQRRAAQVTRGLQLLHQPLEGDVLVRVGAQRHLLHLLEQLAEGGAALHLRAHHQGVDEEADEALQLTPLAAGDGRADDDVVLPRVARQQHLEGGQQRHEGRGARLLAQCLELAGDVGREEDGHLGATVGRHGRARLVRGQLQRLGRTGELLAPPRELLGEHRPPQPLALPDGVVRVLERQRRQRGGTALEGRLVECGDLTHQHAHGPAVRDDVVHVEGEHVLGGAQPPQARADERTRGEVEGPQRVLAELLLQHVPGGVRRQADQVHHVQRQLHAREDELERLALFLTEDGAQRLMARHQLREAVLERGHVQRTLQPHEGGHVVGGAAGLQLVDEPEALLREGQRQGPGARHRDEGGGLAPRRGAPHGVDARGECFEGGLGEQRAQGQLHTEGGADAGRHLRGQQRVAAQLEEVVERAHARHPQHLCPERGEPFLGGSARSDVDLVLAGRRRVRSGQGLPVHLGVGRQREGVQPHQGGGHHVVRQPLLEMHAQGGGVERLGGHDVADEALVTGHVLAHQGHGLAHVGVASQRRLDFGQLDAEAAQLHLCVQAAEELQRAVRAPADPVARAVQARAGEAGEGVGDEALGGERGLLHIAPGEAIAADEQLSRDTHGHRLAVRVQHEDERVAQRPADGERRAHLRRVRQAEGGGEDGALRGAVAVGDGDAQRLQHPAGMRGGDDVAAGEQLLHRAQALQVPVHHLREEARGEPQRRHAGALEHLSQLLQRGRLGRHHHQPRAVQQRAPQLQRGRVEGDGGEEEERLLRPEAGEVDAEHGAQHGRVRCAHALGTPRGAGGEVDVREAVRQRGRRRRGGGPRGELDVLQHHGGHALGGQLRQQLTRGEEHARTRVLHHGREALARVRRVQWHVGRAGLEDGEQRHHQLRGAFHGDGHARVRGHAQLAQVPRELIGACIELTVGELRFTCLHRHLVGEAGHHLCEDVGQGGGARVLRGRGVPVHEHLLALGTREHGQRGQAPLRVRGEAFQQRLEVRQQPRHRRVVEQVRAVDDGGAQSLGQLGGQQRQVHLGRAAVHRLGLHRQPRHVQRGQGRVLQGEQHLEQGRDTELPLRPQGLHHLLEGQVLVGEGAQHLLVDTAHQLQERRVAGQVRAQGHGVDEQADQPLQLRAVAAGHGRADGDVVLPAVARQQHLPRGQQQREEGAALAQGERLK